MIFPSLFTNIIFWLINTFFLNLEFIRICFLKLPWNYMILHVSQSFVLFSKGWFPLKQYLLLRVLCFIDDLIATNLGKLRRIYQLGLPPLQEDSRILSLCWKLVIFTLLFALVVTCFARDGWLRERRFKHFAGLSFLFLCLFFDNGAARV